MFETPITVVGRIITDLRRRVVAGQEVISFRVASNSRRRTAEGTWEPGQTLYITVNCWGKLVTGVGAGLYKGAPIIAVGTVHTNEYEDRDGVKRSSLEMRASTVGPDLSRAIVRIEQPAQSQGGSGEPADDTAEPDADTATAAENDVDQDAADHDDARDEGLVLSA